MQPATALAAGIKRAGNRMLDIVLPPRCLKCGRRSMLWALCAPMLAGRGLLAPPHCAACGLPFEFDLGPDALCGACAGERPSSRAPVPLPLRRRQQGLILRFKHADRTTRRRLRALDGARRRCAAGRCDLIVPVPLHWLRLFMRRYNRRRCWLRRWEACQASRPSRLLLRRRRTPRKAPRRPGRQRNVAAPSPSIRGGARCCMTSASCWSTTC